IQIASDQVEQFLVARVNQLARAADDEAQIAVGAFAAAGEYAALVEEPLRGGTDKADEGGLGDFPVEPRMDADNRRRSDLAQVREERIGASPFRQKAHELCGRNGRDEIGGLQTAAVAQPYADDTTLAEFQRLDDAAALLDDAHGAGAVEIAQPDLRVDEGGIGATREKRALQNLGEQSGRSEFGVFVERRDR